jgi:predicted transcriptional regulator
VNKTTLYLPPELHRGIQDVSRRTGRPQAELIRTAIAEYLRTQDRPVPRSIGAAEDAGFAARDSEDWLRSRWAER